MGKKQKYSFDIPVEKKEKRKKKQKPLTDIPTSDYVVSTPNKFDPVLIKGHSFYGDQTPVQVPVDAWGPSPRTDALQQAGAIASGQVQPSTAPAAKPKGKPALVAKRSKATYSFVDASTLSNERDTRRPLGPFSPTAATNTTPATLPGVSAARDTESNHTDYTVTYRRPGVRPVSKADLREEALVKRWSAGFHSNVDIPLALTLEKETEFENTRSVRSSVSTEHVALTAGTASSVAATATSRIHVNRGENSATGLQANAVLEKYVEETDKENAFNLARENDESERVQPRTSTISTINASRVSSASSESDDDGADAKGSNDILLDAKQVKKAKKPKFRFKKNKSKNIPETSTPPNSPTQDISMTTFILQRPPSTQHATPEESTTKLTTEQLQGTSSAVQTKHQKKKAPGAPTSHVPQALSDGGGAPTLPTQSASGGGGWFSLSASGVFSKGTSNTAHELSQVPEEATPKATLSQQQDVVIEVKKGNKSKKVAMKRTKKKATKEKAEASAYEETEPKTKATKSSKKTKPQAGPTAKKTTVSKSRTMDEVSSQSDDSDKVSTKSAPASMATVGKKSKKAKKKVKNSSKKTKSTEDDHSVGSSGTTSTLKIEQSLVLAQLESASTEQLTETKKSKKSTTKHSKKNNPKNSDQKSEIIVPPLVKYDVHGPMSQEELDDIVSDTKKAKQVKTKFNRIRQKKMTRASLNEADLGPIPGTPTTALLNLNHAAVTSHDNTGFDDMGTINIVTTKTTTGHFVYDEDSDGDGTDGMRIVHGSATGGPVLLLSGLSHNEADDDDDFSPPPRNLVHPDWMHLT